MSTQHRKFSIAILFIIPLLVLASLTIPHFTAIQKGADVYLQTEPIQQEDANENYIVLHYEVEKVPKERMTDSLVGKLLQPAELGQTKVYGLLERRGGVDELVSLTDQKPAEGVYLAGWLPQTTEREYREHGHYIVNFGLDRFYVPKNGHRAAADSDQGDVRVAHFKVLNGSGIMRDVSAK